MFGTKIMFIFETAKGFNGKLFLAQDFSVFSSRRVIFVLAQRRREHRVSAEEYFFKKATLRENLLVHILLVTSILYGDCVTIDGVGIVPVAGMRHVVALPSGYGWQSAEQRHFNKTNCPDCFLGIGHYIFRGKSMFVLSCNIPIEAPNAVRSFVSDFILIPHLSSHKCYGYHQPPTFPAHRWSVFCL